MITAPPTGTTFTFDAENHLTSTAGVTYTYDGDGRRIMKSSGTIYWYGMNSDPLIETDLNNNNQYGYFFFNGKRVFRVSSANEVNHFFTDALGSARAMFTWQGGHYNDSDFYPFGTERPVLANNPSHYKFTGKERDSESSNDYFGARYYSSTVGRFMSPDWSALPEAVPYADLSDPQTLNLYTYVRNNPMNQVDPDGHKCEKDSDGNFHGDTCDKDTGTGSKPDKVIVWSASWGRNGSLKDQLCFPVTCSGINVIGRDLDNYLKSHPLTPFDLAIGFGLGMAVPAPELELASLGRPVWAKKAGGFVNWLKNLERSGTKLTAEQADAIISEAKKLGVDVRLDPPHGPSNPWNVEHLNVGRNGQAHLEVPAGYDNPSVPKGSVRKP